MNCHVSPLKTAGLILLGTIMTSVSYFAATHAAGYVQWVSWFGVLFFGFCTFACVRQLLNKEPVVTIDGFGITARRIQAEPISWSRIEAVSIGKVRSTRFLCVWLKDEDIYMMTLSATRAALARANRALGFPAISVTFQGLTPGLDEAYEEARKYVPERPAA